MLATVAGLCFSATGQTAALNWNPETGLNPLSSLDPMGGADNAGLVKQDAPAAAETPWTFRLTREQVEAIAADDSANQVLLDRVLARNIPMGEESLPNYSYYQGVPVPMNTDATRLAVMVDENTPEAGIVAAAEAAAAAAGLTVMPGQSQSVKHWVLVKVAPMGAAADISAKIDAVVAAGAAFASPVFESNYVQGGFVVITPHVLARRAAEGRAAQVVPGMQVEGPLGDIPGAVRMTSTLRNGYAVLRQANQLALNPAYAWAEPDVMGSMELNRFVPNDPNFSSQWGLDQTSDDDIDAPEAWDITTGISTVHSLVMDVGCQTNHPDLNWGGGRDFTTGVAGGVGDGSPGNACDNHGTAVAGCISAETGNGTNVAGVAGGSLTFNAKIADMMNNPPTCTNSFAVYSSSYVVNALAWGAANGCRTSNASFTVGQSNAIDAAYQTAYQTNGIVNFAAAGNGSTNSLSYPSSAPFVTSVAALDSSGGRASFSNWGTGLDISAPGSGILTLDRTGANGYTSSDMVSANGTSFASPYSAGVAALFLSAHPFATQVEMLAAVLQGAVDLGAAGYDTNYGYGFINAYNTITDPSPADDFCGNATVIATNTYNPAIRNTKWANDVAREPQEDCESGNVGTSSSVYYSFTAPNTGLLSIDTNGSDYDTVLSVFSGCGFTLFPGNVYIQPSELACDDDSGTGTASQITNLALTKGQTVKIKVAKYGSTPGGGNLDFNLNFVPTAPVNDSCGNGTDLPNTYGDFAELNLDTEFATVASCENEESCGHPNGDSNSVWYRFQPTQNGFIHIDTEGSDYDTVVGIFSGCPLILFPGGTCLQRTEIACNDDGGTGVLSLIDGLSVSAGATYMIRVSNYNLPGPGSLDFHFSFYPPCDADVNQDGNTDQGDVDYLINVVAGGANPTGIDPDFNRDGNVDQADIDALINVIAGGACP